MARRPIPPIPLGGPNRLKCWGTVFETLVKTAQILNNVFAICFIIIWSELELVLAFFMSDFLPPNPTKMEKVVRDIFCPLIHTSKRSAIILTHLCCRPQPPPPLSVAGQGSWHQGNVLVGFRKWASPQFLGFSSCPVVNPGLLVWIYTCLPGRVGSCCIGDCQMQERSK